MSGVDYSIIRQELFLLGDSLEPDDVLFFASNPETELNKFFEWDDKTAAQKSSSGKRAYEESFK
jgi:hypothetical protein